MVRLVLAGPVRRPGLLGGWNSLSAKELQNADLKMFEVGVDKVTGAVGLKLLEYRTDRQ